MPESIPVRTAPSDRELRSDALLALALFIGAVISAGLSAVAGVYADERAGLGPTLVFAICISLPLALRKRYPATVAVAVSVAYFAGASLKVPEGSISSIALFIAIYTVGAWSSNRRRALWVRVSIIIGMFIWLLAIMFREAAGGTGQESAMMSPYVASMLILLMIDALFFGGAYYFGEHSWNAALQRRRLQERTAELEREREITAAQAVALERVRIARELHDVVAHHVSLMGVQAGAARAVLGSDAAAASEALRGVEGNARTAIDELRLLLETLRGPHDHDDASAVGVDRLPELAADAERAGMPTCFAVIGTPRPLPDLVQVNLYRIAQESLTNARRHGGPEARADVRLRYLPETVELEIANDGTARREASPGLGQLGMRERATAAGGTIEFGPRPRGGYLVRVGVPAAQTAKQGYSWADTAAREEEESRHG